MMLTSMTWGFYQTLMHHIYPWCQMVQSCLLTMSGKSLCVCVLGLNDMHVSWLDMVCSLSIRFHLNLSWRDVCYLERGDQVVVILWAFLYFLSLLQKIGISDTFHFNIYATYIFCLSIYFTNESKCALHFANFHLNASALVTVVTCRDSCNSGPGQF